jgi:hypothetical protein
MIGGARRRKPQNACQPSLGAGQLECRGVDKMMVLMNDIAVKRKTHHRK